MFGLGTTELILILGIVVIIFGVGKLPEIGTGIGKAIKNFKKVTSDTESSLNGNEEQPKLKASESKQGL